MNASYQERNLASGRCQLYRGLLHSFIRDNHILERDSKIFSSFIDVCKALTQFGLTACFISYSKSWVSTGECWL